MAQSLRTCPTVLPLFPEVPILRVDERSAPPPDGGAYHGFALLQFAGDTVQLTYIDEYGNEFYTERFEK